ncbi:MAG: FHA domain-containing protein [Myxococcales bacterium]|nr:FHA domain-containing protein [Myxococcales bacterium]
MIFFIGKMLERLGNAAATKAKQKTIGKAEAKVMGAQAAAQQKMLRKMDAGMEAVEGKAKGAVARGGNSAQAQAGGPQAGAPYQPVNQNFQPLPQAQAAPPPVQAGGQPMPSNQLTCPNGHALDPSWEVCPYCQTAAKQGVKPVHIQSGGGGAVAGKTMAVSLDQVLGQHVNKAVVGWLVQMEGPQKGQDFRLFDGNNVLGTAADADIVVSDQFVSARHAVILIESKKASYVLQDLESRNKTFVNNRQVMKVDLVDNDEIRMGQCSFRFKSLY